MLLLWSRDFWATDLCSRSRTGRGTSSTATRRTARSNARFLIHTFRHNLEWRLVENMTVCGILLLCWTFSSTVSRNDYLMKNVLHCTESIIWWFNLSIRASESYKLPEKLLPGSVDEQSAKDVHIVGSIAEKQAQIFTEECKPFPEDVQIQSIYPCASASNLMLLSYKVQISSNHIITKWSDIAELELKLSWVYIKNMSNLQ